MRPGEAYLVGRAIIRVLGDSTRTEEIHVTEEITGRKMMQQFMDRNVHNDDYRRLLEKRPELNNQQLDFESLRALPETTLGGAYIRHLDGNGLSAQSQATGTTYVEDETMAYLMRRFRQTHDVWHVLAGLGIQPHEEVIVHAFTLGQMHLPVSYLVIFFGSLKHLILEKRWNALRFGLSEAYRNGKEAKALLPIHWEKKWKQPLHEVRQEFGIRPCTPAYVHF